MPDTPNKDKRPQDDKAETQPPKKVEYDEQATEPAQEHGERIETGRSIHRGGKEKGHVPGAPEDEH